MGEISLDTVSLKEDIRQREKELLHFKVLNHWPGTTDETGLAWSMGYKEGQIRMLKQIYEMGRRR